MKMVEAAGHVGLTGGFEFARHGLGPPGDCRGFGGSEAPPAETEGVPGQSDATAEQNGGDDQRHEGQAKGDRPQPAKERPGRHGNTFRSSSKCGPSRSFGQSPPQTMAVP